jgi:hypothetical protein
MNQLTLSVLNGMVQALQYFEANKISLGKLVGDLEGSLNALEEELEPEFYTEWFNYWGTLEEVRAARASGEDFTFDFQETIQGLTSLIMDKVEGRR